MSEPHKTERWWLAALIVPAMVFGVGVAFALLSVNHQDDWLGGNIIIPILIGTWAAASLCLVFSVVSVVKRERNFEVAILSGLAALAFLVWSTAEFIKGRKEKIAQDRTTSLVPTDIADRIRRMREWREKLRTDPRMITDAALWNLNAEPDSDARQGLGSLLQDKSFVVTPAIKAFIVEHLPDLCLQLADRDLITRSDLESLLRNPKSSDSTRGTARASLEAGRYAAEPGP